MKRSTKKLPSWQLFAAFVPSAMCNVHNYFRILHFRYKFRNLWCVSLARMFYMRFLACPATTQLATLANSRR